jgi:hypothetical protein
VNVVENELEAAIRNVLVNSAYLAAVITGFGAGHVWNGVADEGTPAPYVVFNDQTSGGLGGAQHRYNFGDRRVLTDYVFLVKGLTKGLNTELAGRIDKAIDQTLHSVDLSVSGFTCLLCRRTSNVKYHEVENGGTVYVHRGGLYAIQLTS